MSAPLLPPLPEVPLVSVLTLAYNQERYVAEAVESVLALDWPAERLEYVVIDDGSTDGTARALDPYRDDPRLTVIEQENKGLRGAVDHGLSLLTGDVLTFVAGDDAALPNRARLLVGALQRNPAAGLACSDSELVDAEGAVLRRSFFDTAKLPRVEGRIRGRLLAGNVIPSTGIALRAEMLPHLSPMPAVVPWEDYWWAWAVSGVAEVAHVHEQTYRYRKHDDNLSLGATGAAFARIVDQELPFRRYLFGDVRAGEATAAEMVEGIVMLLQLAERGTSEGVAALAPSASERAEALRQLATAFERVDAGDLDSAALACCRAAAAHPLNPALIALVGELDTTRDHGAAARANADRTLLDELDTRRFAVLADAGTLLARPELLRAYGAAFGPEDDATLVIHADGSDWERLSAMIPALVEGCGLDGDAAPDMVFTTEPPDRLRALGRAAGASLGPDVWGAGLFAFDSADVRALRLLAGRRAPVGA